MKLLLQFFFCASTVRLRTIALVIALAATAAKGDVVFAWNEALANFSAACTTPLSPPIEARAYAMTHLAMDEAIAEASRGSPTAAARLAAQRAAVASAAHTILAELLPAGSAHFDALAATQLAAIPESPDKARGERAGGTAAALVLSKRDHDGWVELITLNPPGGPSPDHSSNRADALLAGQKPPKSPWLEAKPFMLKSAAQMTAAAPYTLTHEGQVLPDLRLRSARMFTSVDHAAAATALERNWAARPFTTWNRIARSAAERASLDLAGEARLLVVLNLALADATLAVLHWRHELGTWRVVTVEMWNGFNGMPPLAGEEIRVVQTEMGPEFARRDMQSVLLPPVRNFPAPVATLAGAAQAAIAGVLKDDRTPLVLPEAQPTASVADGRAPRVLANVSAAARECAFLSSLDGRHSREACVSGYDLGAAIGGYVAKRAASRR